MKLLFRRFNPISDIVRPFDCGYSARGGRCVIVDATICERQDQEDKRKARLVTAQVLRLLDEPLGEGKKGAVRRQGTGAQSAPGTNHEEQPLSRNGRSASSTIKKPHPSKKTAKNLDGRAKNNVPSR